ncbi:MAG: BsaWI family type II restriction enzyme [Methermicoccaceae archaeon]
MNFDELKGMYHKYEEKYGDEAYKHMSALLNEAKEVHKQDWLKKPTPQGDHEQSWRAFKGKNMEKLVQYIITKEVEKLGLKVINGNQLEKASMLPPELSCVKRKLAIDYGEFGLHLPDVDIVIYEPKNCNILSVISIKVTLRERIAQTGYWKLKLLQDDTTKHIRVYFMTPDEDGTLTYTKPPKKARAIVEMDLDGSYVLTEEEIEESDKVKLFENFIDDIKELAQEKL